MAKAGKELIFAWTESASQPPKVMTAKATLP